MKRHLASAPCVASTKTAGLTEKHQSTAIDGTSAETGPRLFCHGHGFDLKRTKDVSDRTGNFSAASDKSTGIGHHNNANSTRIGDLPAMMTRTNRPFDAALGDITGHVGAGVHLGGHQANLVAA